MIDGTSVGIVKAATVDYPRRAPFHPSDRFPEYPFQAISPDPNSVYAGVRELLRTLGLDADHYGAKEWNPLGEIISPGDKVVIKPNFVMDRHYTGDDYDSVVTHGSVIRAVIDYVAIALRGEGQVIVADAPMLDNDFDRIVERTGLGEIVDFYSSQSLVVQIFDLRVENVEMREGLIVRRFKLPGDPLGYVPIDLGRHSEFVGIANLHESYRGSDYDSHETAKHHNDTTNEYLLSKTVLDADVFINMPKLKTHKKIGVTLNLKNLIGINGDKNWIPHYRIGSPKQNGDEYATASTLRHMESLLKDRFKERAFAMAQSESRAGLYLARKLRGMQKAVVENTGFTKIRAGGWYGNDTVWRSVLDLNKILLYADASGNMQDVPQRRFVSIIDGIVGGEGDGPVIPKAKHCGALVGGCNPLAVDLCATTLMGFDYRKCPQFSNALHLKEYALMSFSPDEIVCRSNHPAWRDILRQPRDLFHFEPAPGWVGKIEMVQV
jgi:uncharacterized protein (DUF362 family)